MWVIFQAENGGGDFCVRFCPFHWKWSKLLLFFVYSSRLFTWCNPINEADCVESIMVKLILELIISKQGCEGNCFGIRSCPFFKAWYRHEDSQYSRDVRHGFHRCVQGDNSNNTILNCKPYYTLSLSHISINHIHIYCWFLH